MISTIKSSDEPRSTLDRALRNYSRTTGIDLTNHPSVDKFQNCHSPDDVVQLLLERKNAFESDRDKYRDLIDRLLPVVQIVCELSGVVDGPADLLPLQLTKAIFVGIDVLFSATVDIRANYDALLDLFECVADLLKHLRIFTEKIPLSSTMSSVMVMIMVETLSVLAVATKQMNSERFEKFANKLGGEICVAAILQKLDRLTLEEARVTVAPTLKVVHGLLNNLKIVIDDGNASIDSIRCFLVDMQETTAVINKTKRGQLQRDVKSWLFPTDSSTNHKIALGQRRGGTASWFTQSTTFQEWKARGSLLWIYGKPGSGKTILCSSIIQEVKGLCDMGLALMAYFYCDFMDSEKQDVRRLLASLIVQLSAESDACYHILYALYSRYNEGLRQPDDDVLVGCLEKMLKTEGQPTIYIIIDALDEYPNDSGVKSPRAQVLDLVIKLVDLHLANVRICATSCPEADIRAALGSSASHAISLQSEAGQTQDIADYVSSSVHSKLVRRRWSKKDEEMIVDTLSRKADGVFLWAIFQLRLLFRSSSSVHRSLDELPKSLDETYDRMLNGIARERQEYAHRLFQCLAVSVRPLRAELTDIHAELTDIHAELTDIHAIHFRTGAHPKDIPNWFPYDRERTILSVCPGLITIVNTDGSRVVQFLHSSIKDYLKSERLANAGEPLSRYHILPHSAHMVLAEVYLNVLLAIDVQAGKIKANFPLATYAAQYWVKHTQFDYVSSRVKYLMERLFDPSKSHFATWVWIYDIDHPFRVSMPTSTPTLPEAVSLYYAVLCGFRGLVEHLIFTCPQDINARGGYHGTPLHAAIAKQNVGVTALLLEHGADVAALNNHLLTPLHEASRRGNLDIMELLLKYHAQIDACDGGGKTPLFHTALEGFVDAASLLLRNGATIDSCDSGGWTSLMSASQAGHLDIVRLLLENGATADTRDNDGRTSLMSASQGGYLDVVRLLLQNGATANSRTNDGWTSLMLASRGGHLVVVQLFLQNGETADSHNNHGWTPLMLASRGGHLDVMLLLLRNGATLDSRDGDGWTALMLASQAGHLDAVILSLKNGGTLDFRDDRGWTPLMTASQGGHMDVMRSLIRNGAAVDARDHGGWTPLMAASQSGDLDVVRVLIQSGAAVDSRDNGGWTPLMAASQGGHKDVVRLLIQSGAAVDSRDNCGCTPLMPASHAGYLDVARLLVKSGAVADSYDNYGWTPLMSALQGGHEVIVDLLLGSGAAVNGRCNDHWTSSSNSCPNECSFYTPLHLASSKGNHTAAKLLIQYGANINMLNQDQETPLCLASRHGHLDFINLLLDSGLDVTHRDREGSTLWHRAVQSGDFYLVNMLLQRGADVNIRGSGDKTPLYLARSNGKHEVARLLEQHTEDTMTFRGGTDSTPLNQASRDPPPRRRWQYRH